MHKLGELALWILIIGGLLAGYEAVADRDLVGALSGNSARVRMFVDGALGLSALIVLGGKIKK